MAYTWVPFYKELSQKLLKYRNNRTPLVDWIYDNIDSSLIKHFKDNSAGKRVPDTDPFTVMAIINRGISWDKKIALCKQFKEFLNISAPVPQDFSGVPEMNNMLSNFIGFEENRKEGDIERLWNLFEAAVGDMNIKPEYDALNGQYLIKYNITMGLFWIRPDKYLALDGNNREKIEALGIASFKNNRFVPYNEYEDILKRVDDKMRSGEIGCSSYAEFSQMTYIQNDGASAKDTSKAKPFPKSEKSYWTFSPGEQASKWDFCIKEGVMCIGWDKLGDLSQYSSLEETNQAVKRFYPTEGSAKNDTLAVWQFTNEIRIGDVVFAKKGRNTIIGRGIVESEYMFDNDLSDFKHIRKVKWTEVGEWKTEDLHAMKTLTNVTKYKDYVEGLNKLIDGKETSKPKSTDGKQYWWLTGSPKYWSPSNDWEVGEDIDYTLYNEKGNKRRVFKHFMEAKPGDLVIAYESTPVLQIVAIGSVVSETDGEVLYIKKKEELLSPVPYSEILTNPILKDSEPVMNRCQGSLFKLTQDEYKEIMRLIRKENPEPAEDDEELTEEFPPYSDEDFLKEVFMKKEDYEQLKGLLLRKKNLILQGAPGVGKTFAAKRLAFSIIGEKNKDRIKMVQFHQNYSYEDFVLGYKPNENGGFDLKEGIFYQFCKKAAADKEHPYFFIIDEINRGNLSKIFGELLMMIEKDYRDTTMQMSYADKRLAVPSNVYLIGMMNTADRSLAMIDYALRRRFSFYEMKPAFDNPNFKEEIKKQTAPHLNELVKALEKLNEVIANDDSLGTGFCIGHSYLCDLGEKNDLESIVEYDIIPMLREYWFDNNERFNIEARKLREAVK
jgi:5-methylcytosine-specific restriction protein B